MAISDCTHIIGTEARRIAVCIEAGDGIVKQTAPPDIERRALWRCGAYPVQRRCRHSCDDTFAVGSRPCRIGTLRQHRGNPVRHVDVLKHRTEPSSKFMLSNRSAGDGLTADKRLFAHRHDPTLAGTSKLR
jgi:hypothetical protein